jgi:hypothetical protein
MDNYCFTPTHGLVVNKHRETSTEKIGTKANAERGRQQSSNSSKHFTRSRKVVDSREQALDGKTRFYATRWMSQYAYNSTEQPVPKHKAKQRRRSRSVELQDREIQIIMNLDKCGTPHETISQSFKISVDQVKRILQPSLEEVAVEDPEVLIEKVKNCLKNPKFYRFFLEELKQKSQKFRCAMTSRLMIKPVVASDDKIYEERIIKQWLTTSNKSPTTGARMTEDPNNLNLPVLTSLLKESQKFAQLTLLELSICLKQNIQFEQTKALAAEIVSVLPPSDNSEGYSLILSALDPSQLNSFLPLLFEPHDNPALQALQLLQSLKKNGKLVGSIALELVSYAVSAYYKTGDFTAAIGALKECSALQEIDRSLVEISFKLLKVCSSPQVKEILEVVKPLLLNDVQTAQELERTAVDCLVAGGALHDAAKIVTTMLPNCQPSVRLWMVDKLALLNLPVQRRAFLQNCVDANAMELEGSEMPSAYVESLRFLNELVKANLVNEQDVIIPMDLEERTMKLEQHQETFESSTKAIVASTSQQFIELLDVFKAELAKIEPRLRTLESTLPDLSTQLKSTSSEVGKLRGETAAVREVTEKHICWSMSEDQLPRNRIIYSYEFSTKRLYLTDLKTGEQKRQVLDVLHFDEGCQCTVLPKGNLFLTGGVDSNRVWIVKPRRNYTAHQMTPMHSMRNWHGSIYYQDYVYVLGGEHCFASISKCERYDISRGVWRILPDLPEAVCGICPAVVEQTSNIYVLGGRNGVWFDIIQVLDIEKGLWSIMNIKLSQPDSCLPCFKLRADSVDLLFVLNGKLFVLRTKEDRIQFIRSLGKNVYCNGGPSYFFNESLYCFSSEGYALKVEVGSFLI